MSANKYLDENGAVLLNQLLAAKFNTKADKTEIPTKTSDLTNDSNFPVDANYVHTDNNYTTAEKDKLGGIEAGAQVNKIETIKVNNVAQTITSKSVDITVPTNNNQLTNGAGYITKNVNDLTYYTTTSDMNNALGDKLDTSLKGAANGLAELDSNGKVPSSQLPGYVDDVVEGYYYNSKFYKEAAHTTEITGETGKIYVDLDSGKTYRWGGSAYVEISSSLALGETSSTAYYGDKGKTAYDHATDANRLTTAKSSAFYKFATTAEGHIKSVTAVAKTDLTGLGVEDASNKVTSISGSSTDTQYPSAKLVYDQLALKQDVIDSSHKLSADNIDDTSTTHKFTTAEDISKLAGIESGAEVNIIEVIKVDGTALTVTDKAVNITGKENTSNKVTSLSSSSTNTQYPSAKLVYDQLALKEATANKVTSLSSSSTDTQYPSAKLVYDQLALKEDANNKVTSLTASSTDTQYPSAKLVYDQLALKLDSTTAGTTYVAKAGDTMTGALTTTALTVGSRKSGSTTGTNSVAEGKNTTASGSYSHAEGQETIAQRLAQHVHGEYNIADTSGTTTTRGDYVYIIGNGTATNARSNAHTVKWNGEAWFAGDIYVGSTSGTNKDSGSKKVATEYYVSNNYIAAADLIPLTNTEVTNIFDFELAVS